MKRRGSASSSKPKGGRPWGETSYSGKGMMTAYTKPFNNKMTIKVSGRKATSNGANNLAGRNSSKTYVHDPNIRRKPN